MIKARLRRAFFCTKRKNNVLLEHFAPVAQLDRVSASEVEGRAFESHQVYKKECFFKALFFI